MLDEFWHGSRHWLGDDYHSINTITTLGPAVQYYILTKNSKFTQVLSWLGMHNVPYSVHLNRTRFELDIHTRLHTEFMLRYGDCCDVVDPDADLVTGLIA